jgi:tRNA pseudouridine(55) synthase
MTPITNGILTLNKPPGMTSRQAVDLVKRLVRPAKVGHAGTLDPLACGVLVVAIGKATRLIEFVQQAPKRYQATFLLGRTSPTDDVEGEITELFDPPIPSRAEIERASQQFVGTIEQRPPAFSAIKVGGRRAYDLARGGRAVELAPRPVAVYEISVLAYEYPIEQSIDPRRLIPSELAAAIQPPQVAVADLPTIVLDEREIERLAHGRSLAHVHEEYQQARPLLVAVDQKQQMVAILKRGDDGALWPYINFVGKG